MGKEFIPGWALMFAVALAATALSGLIEVGGKQPIEAAIVAILLGILIRNTGIMPDVCRPGVRAFEKVLIPGIVLIGASLDFRNLLDRGFSVLAIILITMGISFFAIYALGRAFRLSATLAALLSVGTTICGGTAIAITAPLIRAKEEETSYAIGTIALWGLIAIILYPKVARASGVSDLDFGLFAGTAIHSTPQVVGAGFIFSEMAGKTATAVKLIRNCFMAPLALLVALWHTRRAMRTQRNNGLQVHIARAFPWFLFGYFVMAGLNTRGYFPPEAVRILTAAGKFLILLGLSGIGLNTVFRTFRKVGLKPLIVGLIGAVVVAACSVIMIRIFA